MDVAVAGEEIGGLGKMRPAIKCRLAHAAAT